jgi:hypothetical protein
LATAAFPLLQTTPASAANNGAWSVAPTAPPGAYVGRGLFNLSLTPGQNYRDSVTVANETTAPLRFNFYAADAYNTANGGFSLHRRTDPKRDIAAWIQLPTEVLNVPARTEILVPFVVAVPPDATPGDHAGGIVAESTQGTTTQHGSVGVTVLQAVGTRVYGRVAGPINPSFNITNFSVNANRGLLGLLGGAVKTDVKYTIVNNGNVILNPKTGGQVSPLIGSSTNLNSVDVPVLLPHGTATVDQHVGGLYPIFQISSTLHVTATGYSVTRTVAASTLVIPWLAIAIIALAVLVLFWRSRRRRRRAAVPPAGGRPPRQKVPV